MGVASGRVVGVETLVRWDHPVEGVLTPDTFIDLTESAGLISGITNRVLEGRSTPVGVGAHADSTSACR